MLTGSILLTGGTGTLGRALIARAMREQWDARFTVYSRDPVKQQHLQREFPTARFVIGSVEDREGLMRAAVGHDVIIHLAAQKHIPEAERNPHQTYLVNVTGSQNVLLAALTAQVRQVVAVSTDKACHPVNAYGCTKLMMEREYQAFAQTFGEIKINLCRYGNVVGSSGSVVPLWQEHARRGLPLPVTRLEMTRFWLTIGQAVDIVLAAARQPSGTVYIPTPPALSMGKLAEYLFPESELEVVGLRPGEKMHEELLAEEESPFTLKGEGHYLLWPVTGAEKTSQRAAYISSRAPELTRDELRAMLE